MRVLSLVLWILICQAVGLLGARWTTPEIPAWYRSLRKPAFNPPNWVFGPVWTLLYLLMAIAAWLVTESLPSAARNWALDLFAIQLGLNLAWSWIFFRRHAMRWAAAELLLLWAIIGVTVVAFARVDGAASAFLLPYWAWVTFAAILNASIAHLNSA